MLQERQGLLLGLEAGEHPPGVHAGLDDLQGYLSLDRFGLLGEIDGPHATLAQYAKEFVAADAGTRTLDLWSG